MHIPWWGRRSTGSLDMAAQLAGKRQRKGDLDHVKRHIREYAPGQRGPQPNALTAHGVYHHEPGGAEGVAHQQSQEHVQAQAPQLAAQKPLHGPHNQGGADEAQDIPAGLAQQDANAAGEV